MNISYDSPDNREECIQAVIPSLARSSYTIVSGVASHHGAWVIRFQLNIRIYDETDRNSVWKLSFHLL